MGLLFCCGSVAMAQNNSCLDRTIPVSVIDETGAPVGGLTAADFRAEIHGRGVKIVGLSEVDRPHRTLILLDASGIMNGGMWITECYAAEKFADSNRPNNSLALYIFGEKANDRVGFLEGSGAVQSKLRQSVDDPEYMRNHVRGKAALRDAILEGIKFFGVPMMGDSMFIITDGYDDSSKSGQKQLRNKVEGSGIRLFFCLLSYGSVSGDGRLAIDIGSPKNLAENSGGGLLGPVFKDGSVDSFYTGISPPVPSHPIDVPDDLVSDKNPGLLRALAPFYTAMTEVRQLEIVLDNPVERPEKLKLSLSKEKAQQLKGAKILYPHELSPCGATQPE